MASQSLDDQFVDLLTANQGPIFGYIYAAVRNLDDAEELYQLTSIVLWRKFSEFRSGSDFVGWALRVAKYEILHFQRDRRRRAVFFSDEVLSRLASAQAAFDSDTERLRQEALAKCVDALAPDDRQLVQACYGTHDSIKEVARRMGRSAQTLYNSLSRIRRLLFDCVNLRLVREREQ